MSSISVGTTTTTGYVVTSDSTGALVLKTGASATTAVTIDTSQNVTFVGSQTLSGGTANGVLYLNGSKAAISGSALTFDGTNFASTGSGTLKNLLLTGGTLPGAGNPSIALRSSDNVVYHQSGSANNIVLLDSAQNTMQSISATANIFNISNAEGMRLTSTGLGIGTSSPSAKLDVRGNFVVSDGTNGNVKAYVDSNKGYVQSLNQAQNAYRPLNLMGSTVGFENGSGNTLTFDSSGRLLVGTTSSIGTNVVGKIQSTGTSTFISTNNEVAGFIGVNSNADNSLGIGSDPDNLRSGSHIVFYVDGLSEKARITSAGVVAINPLGGDSGSKLAVYGGGSGALGSIQIGDGTLSAGSTNYWNIGRDNTTSGAFTFALNGTERARIDTSGNLLVGCTALGATGGFGVGPNSGSSFIDICHVTGTASGTAYARFFFNSSQIGSITQSGTTAVLYNTTSDQRLKENIADADSASSLIDSLQVRQFNWKSDNSHQRYGFVAQELVTVAPEAVHQPIDPDQMMAVD